MTNAKLNKRERGKDKYLLPPDVSTLIDVSSCAFGGWLMYVRWIVFIGNPDYSATRMFKAMCAKATGKVHASRRIILLWYLSLSTCMLDRAGNSKREHVDAWKLYFSKTYPFLAVST